MSDVATSLRSDYSRVWGVVLAAGASRRMGRPKVLLPYAGRTLLEHAVGAALGAGLGRSVVVLGDHAGEAARVLVTAWPGREDLLLVTNPDYQSGQASSVRAGLAACLARSALGSSPGGTRPGAARPAGIVFLLADQPLVGPPVVRALAGAYLAAAETPAAVAPVHQGRRGNPVLIGHRLYAELQELTGDTGPRELLRRHAAEMLLVEAGPEVLIDVDSPADYERLRRPGSATS